MNLSNFFGMMPYWLCRYRWWVLSVYAVIFVLSFLGAGKIWKDDSLESWFGKDSEIFKNQKKVESYFGSNENVYIVYEAIDGDIFSERSLKALKSLHDEFSSFGIEIQKNSETPLKHTREIMSLINVQVTDIDGDNLYMSDFVGNYLPETESKRQALKAKALANNELRLSFVSLDTRYGAIVVKTDFGESQNKNSAADPLSDESLFEFDFEESYAETAVDNNEISYEDEAPKDYDQYLHYMKSLRQLAEKAEVSDDLVLHYAGLPELIAFQIEVLDAEMIVIFIGIFVLILILLGVVFKHASALIWPSIVILGTVFMTMGTVGWIGIPTSSLSDPMILMIALISVADSVHLLSSYRYHRIKGLDHETSLSKAMAKAGFSCLLTTVTTVVGFGSLWIVKPSIPVANFGFFCGVGLLYAFIVTVTLLPILIDFWKLNISSKSAKESNSSNYAHIDKVFNLTNRYPIGVLASLLVIVGIIGAGVLHLRVDTNTLETFDESTYLRQSFEIADKHMGGTQNIDFMFNLAKSDALYDAQVLKGIENIQLNLKNEFPELVVTTISIVDILKRINQQFNADNPEFYRLPESPGEISQLLFLFNNLSPEERRRLVSDDFSAARLAISLRNSGSSDYVELVNKAKFWGEEYALSLKENYPSAEVITSGGVITFMHLFDKMAHSQIQSFAITFCIIAVVLFLVFRSFSLGVLALVSSVFPIIVIFGVMGWMGIDLNPTTMIIAPIILGIAVDDSVHFINKLKMILPKSESMSDAIKTTLREVGVALCFTTLVLSGGLLMMLYSSDSSFQAFGYLSALSIGTALIIDLLFIPAVCLRFMKHDSKGLESSSEYVNIAATTSPQ